MACDFAIFVNAGQHQHATQYAVQALDLVDRLEDQLSIYREHSEVSQMNRAAAAGEVRLQKNLFDLFTRAVHIHRVTAGAFDITSGPLTQLWNDARRHGRIPTDEEVHAVLRRIGSQHIHLTAESQSIHFLRSGMHINLGGIGKGYALEEASLLLQRHGIDNFLIHGGRSSVTARGSRQSATQSTGWTVGLKHPLRPNVRLAEIQLHNRAMGTSGSASHAFRYQGRRIGHILDPRSGFPAAGVLSATVLASDATTADALSTAFYVMGVQPSFELCAAQPDLAAIFVTEAARSGSVELQTTGIPDQQWQQLAS